MHDNVISNWQENPLKSPFPTNQQSHFEPQSQWVEAPYLRRVTPDFGWYDSRILEFSQSKQAESNWDT